MSRYSVAPFSLGVVVGLSMAAVVGLASAQDLAAAGRPPGNLLNGGASSFQTAPPSLLPPGASSGMTKAGALVTAADVGVDLYQGKKSKVEIAGGVIYSLGKGYASSQGAGFVGGLIGGALGGPPGAAAGYELGSAGTTAIMTLKEAYDTGGKISQALADRNVKQAIDDAFTPKTWIDLPPVEGSPAAKAQGWVELPPVPGSAADRGGSILGPAPARDLKRQWPVCPKCGKRHDPNEK
jgi:hypothetical protein